MLQSTKLFFPLSGTELQKIILKDAERQLAANPNLASHLTFPKATYKVEIAIESYPCDFPVITRAEGVVGEAPEDAKPTVSKVVFSREIGETQATAPDALRLEAELPQPQTVRQEDTGTHIDQSRSVTVGEGTKPRGRGRPRKVAAVAPQQVVTPEAENLVDDFGQPIRMNTGA